MDLQHLRYFVTPAAARRLRCAAQRRHRSQPALSMQFKALEQGLATRPLGCTQRRVERTPAGKVCSKDAREILLRVERAASRCRGSKIVSPLSSGRALALTPASMRNLGRPRVLYRPLRETRPSIQTGLAWRNKNTRAALERFVQSVR